MAAWAKFTTPDERCVKTSPRASDATTAPPPRPAKR
jgi:hypothetical protein